MERWEVTTETGSLYRIGIDADARWWVSAENATNPTSCSLADGCWEIQAPNCWPPDLGRPFEFRALAHLAHDSPKRIPGGGKITSAVTDVRHVPGSHRIRFPLGKLVMTPAALALADELETDIPDLLARHLRGDWGRVGEDGYAVNTETLTVWHGTVLSSWGEGNHRLWIATSIPGEGGGGITTCIMLPSEW